MRRVVQFIAGPFAGTNIEVSEDQLVRDVAVTLVNTRTGEVTTTRYSLGIPQSQSGGHLIVMPLRVQPSPQPVAPSAPGSID